MNYLKDALRVHNICSDGPWHAMLVVNDTSDVTMGDYTMEVPFVSDGATAHQKAVCVTSWDRLGEVMIRLNRPLDVAIFMDYRGRDVSNRAEVVNAERKFYVSWDVADAIASYDYNDGLADHRYPHVKLLLGVGDVGGNPEFNPRTNVVRVAYTDNPAVVVQDALKRNDHTVAVVAEEAGQLTKISEAFRKIGISATKKTEDEWLRSLELRGVKLASFARTIAELLAAADPLLISKMAWCSVMKSDMNEVATQANARIYVYSPEGTKICGPENGRRCNVMKVGDLYMRIPGEMPEIDSVTVVTGRGVSRGAVMEALLSEARDEPAEEKKVRRNKAKRDTEKDTREKKAVRMEIADEEQFDHDDEVSPADFEKKAMKTATELVDYLKKHDRLPKQRDSKNGKRLYMWLNLYRRKVSGDVKAPAYPAVTEMLDDNIPNWREGRGRGRPPKRDKNGRWV